MRHILFLLTLTILFTSCDEDVEHIQVDPAFSAYVSGFTSGVVSSQSTIKIVLLEPHPKASPGSVITDDLFEFDPDLEGMTYWLDEQTIEFRPHQPLPSGESFVCTFSLGEVLDVPEEFEEMKFSFIVITQSLFVQFEGMRSESPTDFSLQTLFGTVRTNDAADPAALEQCVSATQNGKALEMLWEHTPGSNVHTYQILHVARGEEASFVELNWDGEPIGSEAADELEIRVPPLGEFTLVQVNTVNVPSLYFSLQFSDPVDTRQDLQGLIHLQSGMELRLSVEGNEIKAYPAGTMNSTETIIIEQSVRNAMGNTLQESYTRTVEFNLAMPALELIGEGVIMPTSGGISFPFRAVNLKAVNLRVIRVFESNVPQFLQVNELDGSRELTRVGRLVLDKQVDLHSSEPINYSTWNNFSIDLSTLVKPEPGAIYRITLSFDRHQSMYPCAESDDEVWPVQRDNMNFDDGSDYFYDDYFYYEDYEYDYYDDYVYEDRDNPCKPSFYRYNNRSISANLLASDLGIIAKEQGGGTYEVVVTNLQTTKPLSGAEVEVCNFQHQVIAKGKTNGDGIARVEAGAKAYLVVVKQGDQRGYLRVDNGTAINLSAYEVGGTSVKRGVKGFIYGERGVWRPGDSIYLSFMLEDQLKSLPKNHPVVLEFFDPTGKLYDKKIKTRGVEGIYAFGLKTAESSPTGNWRVRVSVGNSEFHKAVKIETIKPNRLRIDFDIDDMIRADDGMALGLNTQWLYGSPGANLSVRSELVVENMKTTFPRYEGYQFDDRSKSFYFGEAITAEGRTNSSGEADLYFEWDGADEAPGMLKVKLSTKVFENGGDFSQDFTSTRYSPYTSYVGVKMDVGVNWWSALNTEESHGVGIVALSENGEPLRRDVTIELYKVKGNWWWEGNDENELTRFVSRYSSELLLTEEMSINGKGIYTLKFPEVGWGRYMLRVVDQESGHSTSQVFYGEYPGWYTNDQGHTDAAAMLNITANQPDYKTGDEVTVTVPSGGIGKVYVTIEKGDQILDRFWVEAGDGNTTFSFTATEAMAPNAYVSAVLIQPHGQKENSLPLRMFGVLPIYVHDPATKLAPVIKAPETLKPEQQFEVKVSEDKGRPMAYTIAIVDEGLLGLTRYKTPDPWSHFYAKEGLGVRMWDMYKHVMSAQTGKMASLLAIGGDEGLVYKEDDKANRFKPVVKYLGPFYLKKGATATHQFTLPNYIGAVRIMVVAGYDGAYGASEKEVQVNQPLMVMSTVPRVLGPSERIQIPVSAISMDDRIKTARIKVSSNDLLMPLESVTRDVSFKGKGEVVEHFEFEVARKLGVAKFKVEVTSGKERAFEEVEVLVRPPNPQITKELATLVESGASWTQSYQAVGITGTNAATLVVSRIPDLNIEKNLEYLLEYPHGCLEQTTSKAFPQLFVHALVELTPEQKDKVRKNITAALNRLREYQSSRGGFSYWPGSNGSLSDWGTSYAGHFMLEAKSQGYDLPPGMLDQWMKFQKAEAASWTRSSFYNNDLGQAYRLFTLALSGSPDIGAMNRLRSDASLSKLASIRLATAYAIIGRADVARELARYTPDLPLYYDMCNSYGSTVRDLSMMLETMTYLKDYEMGRSIIADITKLMNNTWQSTQSRAYAMIALAKFVGNKDAGDGKFTFRATVNGKTMNYGSEQACVRIPIEAAHLQAGTITIENPGGTPLFASLFQSGIPIEHNNARERADLSMSVSYLDMQNIPIDVRSIAQGTDFKAVITVSHPGIRINYDELALSQMFPSGWQIVNTRVGEEGDYSADAGRTGAIEYQDIRDDRVYSYFDLGKGKSCTVEVLLNATFVGRYYQPAIYCAPMYDESIHALEPGQWVEVRNPATP